LKDRDKKENLQIGFLMALMDISNLDFCPFDVVLE
jgi:hypothetical protein